jgi:NAD(P)-dependent dehydrogenase (short-subunit alcohol dehydrogenase family)
MHFDLSGKTIVITGASSGLGWHFASILSKAGAKVVLVARRRSRLDDLARDLERQGAPSPVVAEADVTSVSSIRSAVSAIVTEVGAVNGLVNNAGTVSQSTALDSDAEEWNRITDTNLKGSWFFATAIAGAMIDSGSSGTIINIASITGLRTTGGVGPYAVSKAGVIHMTRQLAMEWARHDIRVNALAPGYIETDLNREFFRTDAGRALIKRIPQRRLGRPSDLDAPLLMLCDDASAFMTGSVITVDGGHSVNSL